MRELDEKPVHINNLGDDEPDIERGLQPSTEKDEAGEGVRGWGGRHTMAARTVTTLLILSNTCCGETALLARTSAGNLSV
jgi:hypothetical protein